MNFKIGLYFLLIVCFLLTCGCLNSDENDSDENEIEPENPNITKYGLNPLNKNVSLFFPSSENIPPVPEYLRGGEGESDKVIHETGLPTPMTFKELSAEILNESETVVYVTVLETLPAVQTEFDEVYTPIVFKADDMAEGNTAEGNATEGNATEGNAADTITVQIRGGYAENFGFISEDGRSPTPWDFKAGDKYLLYLKNPDSNSIEDDYYHLVYRGIFVVNDYE